MQILHPNQNRRTPTKKLDERKQKELILHASYKLYQKEITTQLQSLALIMQSNLNSHS